MSNSAMREALVSCMDYFQRIDHPMNDCMRGLFETAYNKTKAALAAPRKNCEVGTAEEQAKRHANHCDTYLREDGGNPCTGCPCCGKIPFGKCEFAWAQMPYDEGRGEER